MPFLLVFYCTKINERILIFLIFAARGPNFNENVTIEAFQNVNVYSLLCELMKIKGHISNGSLTPFKDALKNQEPNAANSFYLSKYLLSFFAITLFSVIKV
jgi:hypothetical protein